MDFEGFNEPVWFLEKAITNILLLLRVKNEYAISYDGKDFIVHQALKGYSDMVFVPHLSGLHVFNPHDSRGLASFAFVETVEDNMALFTKITNQSSQSSKRFACRTCMPIRGGL